MTAPRIPYGRGTDANGGCDECWSVPSRHCCMWNDPPSNVAFRSARLRDAVFDLGLRLRDALPKWLLRRMGWDR